MDVGRCPSPISNVILFIALSVLLSLNRPTSASSVSSGGVPDRAVDGDTRGQWRARLVIRIIYLNLNLQ